MSKRKPPTVLEQRVKELTSHIKTTEELEDLTRLLKKTTLEAMLEGEMADHLGYVKHAYWSDRDHVSGGFSGAGF